MSHITVHWHTAHLSLVKAPPQYSAKESCFVIDLARSHLNRLISAVEAQHKVSTSLP